MYKISFSVPSTCAKGQYGIMILDDSHLPAIDCQYLPRYVGACTACEKHSWAFEVVRTAPSARWDAIQDASSSRFVVDQGLVHVGLDVTWCNLRFGLATVVPNECPIDFTALTLMPLDAHWLLKDFVSCATPPFAAAYAGTLSPPWKDTSEATLMIDPRCGGLPLGGLVSM